MSQPRKSRRTLWIGLAIAVIAIGAMGHFLGAGDAIGFLQKLHGE